MKVGKLVSGRCFRLMGIEDLNFEQIAENQSNASLYHLAGDSIVASVLVAIFKKLINGE